MATWKVWKQKPILFWSHFKLFDPCVVYFLEESAHVLPELLASPLPSADIEVPCLLIEDQDEYYL